jgi:hypothetical protein
MLLRFAGGVGIPFLMVSTGKGKEGKETVRGANFGVLFTILFGRYPMGEEWRQRIQYRNRDQA